MSLLFFLALMSGCCGYALWRGGEPERVAATLQILAFASDFALNRLVDGSTYARMQMGSASLDLALLACLFVLAHRSTRFWPLWLAAWQAAAIVSHAAKALDPGMLPTGYAVLAALWAYPMLLMTAVGTWRHRRRLELGVLDVPWKPIST